MKLSEQQIEQFNEEGFLIVESALQNSDLEAVIQEYATYIDRQAQKLYAEGKISQRYEHEPFERRLACICEENTEIYDEIDIMHFRGKAVFDFFRNDNLLDLVEGIVGPEIACSPVQHVRAKMPERLKFKARRTHAAEAEQHAGRQRVEAVVRDGVAPWHQDVQVVLDDAESSFILTVWLPLCDATPENGCLQIIPGSHKTGIVYWSSGFGISEDNLPEGEVLTLPMKKGSVLFMPKLMPHRSTPNDTDGIRWSMDLRYQETGTPTGRSFYPDFVVRSRSNPVSVLTNHAEWCRLWMEALKDVPTDKRPARAHRPQHPSSLGR